MRKDVEIGGTMCRDRRGRLRLGPLASGEHDHVRIDISCPQGGKPVGIWHTHPQGVAQPLSQDLIEAARLGLDFLCITVPDTNQSKCFRVKR